MTAGLQVRSNQIRLVDLRREFALYGQDWLRAIQRVLASSRYIGGEEVEKFETEFARSVGCKCGVATASGSDALRLTLLGLRIGSGDEVVTVSHTFTSSVDAIVHAGATPVMIDIDPSTFTMNAKDLERAMNPRVRAILPVHLYGHPVDVEAISAVAERWKVPWVEDAAQAHGSRFRGMPCGSFGVASCFSFYPSKNLGALGDAGMITTNDEPLAARLRLLREYGQRRKYIHSLIGFNSRLDALQAAVLSEKLVHLERRNELRRRLASRYRKELEACGTIVPPVEATWATPNYHLFVVRVPNRDAVRRRLATEGIETGIHYPIPVHLQESYRGVGRTLGTLPNSVQASREVLSLPMFPELEEDEVSRVATCLISCIPVH